jgi:hypothetical protein
MWHRSSGLEFGIYSFQILTVMLFVLYSIPTSEIRKSISVRPVPFPLKFFFISSSSDILRSMIAHTAVLAEVSQIILYKYMFNSVLRQECSAALNSSRLYFNTFHSMKYRFVASYVTDMKEPATFFETLTSGHARVHRRRCSTHTSRWSANQPSSKGFLNLLE